MAALNALVSESIDVVVHASRHNGVPQVNEILAVEEQQVGAEATSFTVTDVFGRQTRDGPLQWTGAVPARISDALAQNGHDIRDLLRDADRAQAPRSVHR